MPPRDKVSQLPEAVRKQISQLLMENGFSGYAELERLILYEHGVRISKSALHRHGQKLERRLMAIKASTEAAKAIAQAAPDDEDHRSSAVISLIQSETFETLLDLQDLSDEELPPSERMAALSSAAKNIAQLSNASLRQKKHEGAVREQAKQQALQEAAVAMEQSAKLAGVSAETISIIRRDLLGMAS